jgi:hypothetical protein
MAASAGCSLIDAYGTVVTETASDAGHGGEDGSIRKGKDASTEDARKGLETGTQAEAEPTDTGEEDAGPPTGAIVVSGEGTVDGGLEYVLAVLDPTGNELSREKMAVVGITFDGLLDQWYILEDTTPGTVESVAPGGPFTAPGDSVVMHTRKLDTHTGAWKDLGSVPVPPPFAPDYVVALNQRLAYIAYAADDAASTAVELVVIDTSAPNTFVDAGMPLPLSQSPVGLIGTRDLSGPGGHVTFLQEIANADGGGTYQFELLTSQVTATGIGPLGAAQEVGPGYSASTQAVGGASYIGGNVNVLAIPPETLPGTATVSGYDSKLDTLNQPSYGTFTASSSFFRPIAISECRQTAFVVATKDVSLYTVPLISGLMAPAPFDLGQNGSDIRYEPYTNTALAPYNSGGANPIWGITFISVTETGASNARTLALTNELIQQNADLRPIYIATRTPVPGYLGFNCTEH